MLFGVGRQGTDGRAATELSCGGQGDAFISRASHLDGRFLGTNLAPVAFGVVETFAGPALVANKHHRVGFPHRAHLSYSVGFGWLARGKRGARELRRRKEKLRATSN